MPEGVVRRRYGGLSRTLTWYSVRDMATKTKQTAQIDPHPETLAQFARAIDAHVGRAVAFDKHVSTLHRAKIQLGALAAARKSVHAHVKRARMIGHTIVTGSDGQLYEICETEPKPPIRRRAAASAVVKKADEAAWRRATISAPFVQVKAPLTVTHSIDPLAAPAEVKFMPPAEAVTVYKTHPAWHDLRRLSNMIENTKAALLTIADLCDWDGGCELGPAVFGDGWTVQLRRREYRSDQLEQVEPALFERLAEVKLTMATRRVYVRLAGQHDDNGESGEFDEIDGD